MEYVASISGYRLLACSTIFGTTGDLIKVNLEIPITMNSVDESLIDDNATTSPSFGICGNNNDV